MMKSLRDSELPGSSPLQPCCLSSPDPSLDVPECPSLGQVPLLVFPTLKPGPLVFNSWLQSLLLS